MRTFLAVFVDPSTMSAQMREAEVGRFTLTEVAAASLSAQGRHLLQTPLGIAQGTLLLSKGSRV
jgi:hypothetical protein